MKNSYKIAAATAAGAAVGIAAAPFVFLGLGAATICLAERRLQKAQGSPKPKKPKKIPVAYVNKD